MGGNRSAWREPTQAQGGHVNSHRKTLVDTGIWTSILLLQGICTNLLHCRLLFYWSRCFLYVCKVKICHKQNTELKIKVYALKLCYGFSKVFPCHVLRGILSVVGRLLWLPEDEQDCDGRKTWSTGSKHAPDIKAVTSQTRAETGPIRHAAFTVLMESVQLVVEMQERAECAIPKCTKVYLTKQEHLVEKHHYWLWAICKLLEKNVVGFRFHEKSSSWLNNATFILKYIF